MRVDSTASLALLEEFIESFLRGVEEIFNFTDNFIR